MKKIPLSKVIEDAKKCNKSVPVKEVANIVEFTMASLYHEGKILKEVEQTIGEHKFNVLMTSIIGTIISSTYANFGLETDEERMAYGASINASAIGLIRKKDNNGKLN